MKQHESQMKQHESQMKQHESQMKQHELETVPKPYSRGTGVSPVREKTLCLQHRRDACATRNLRRTAILRNRYENSKRLVPIHGVSAD